MTHAKRCRHAFPMLRLLSLVLALCAVAACAQRENSELEWARAALQRNPNVEIIATDTQAGVFTLRDRLSTAVTTVALNELAAVPTSQLIPTTPAPPLGTQSRVQAAEPTAEPAPGPMSPESMSPGPMPSEAAQRSAGPPAPQSPASAAPVANAERATPPAAAKNYTIERAGGQLRVSGPGISIVSAGSTGSAGAPTASPLPSAEPFICEGKRMLHFDSRSIRVDGDAIIARGGCELYVTNSRIVASGTGIVVQDAVVHIVNSQIEGTIASFHAASGAKLFVRGSTFRGISRRDEHASVQDQGGNQWH